MQNRDIFALLITFMLGFFSGFYLYLVGFSPNFSLENKVTPSAPEYVVVGERYGGCQLAGSCPSFRLEASGEYRFVPARDLDSETRTVKEGNLPQTLLDVLNDAVESTDFETESILVSESNCASFVDGIDTLYSISADILEYNLDTCGTAFDENGQLSTALEQVWNYLNKQ